MRVCLVGGIFDRDETYQRQVAFLTEPLLAAGLRARGVDVVTAGHHAFIPEDGFDVVHVHHIGKGALRMATAPYGAKFVYTAHDNPRLLDPKWTAGHTILRTRILSTRLLLSRTDAIVALTSYEQDYLRSLFPEHSDKVRIIPNGLPSDVFFPSGGAPKSTANRRYKILYVGQLIPLKGLDVLLDAMRQVADRHDAELLLVYHNTALEEQCKQRARELGLVDRVRFLGIKSGHELAELYRNVDMHVLPSFTESLPGVITEAMLTGLPVVASAVGGVPEQVGRHARLVEPGNVAELAAAIERTLDDIAEGKIDPIEISSYARSQFRTEVMVERHLRLYEELTQRRSGPVRRQVRYRPANAAAQLALTAIGAKAQGRGWLEG